MALLAAQQAGEALADLGAVAGHMQLDGVPGRSSSGASIHHNVTFDMREEYSIRIIS